MDRNGLEAELAAGTSIEAIARARGRPPSTVAYWVSKHGLESRFARRHAARGGLERDTLAALVDRGLPIRAIAAELGVSYGTVRHWLRKHGLQTNRSARQAVKAASLEPTGADAAVGECPIHGVTALIRQRSETGFRCLACRKQRVLDRRRRVKEILVAETGGACALCGYRRHLGALHFHHLDPSSKAFALSRKGVTRSLDASREEARKCVLLCANCHAEVEAGVATLAVASADNPREHVPG